MNLLDISKYKERLEKERCLCASMALVAMLGININLDSEDLILDKSKLNYGEEIHNEQVIQSKRLKSYKTDVSIDNSSDKKIEIGLEYVSDSMDELYVKKVYNSALAIEPSYEEKMAFICERDGYTYEQLDKVLAGCVAEACDDGNNYDEAYNTASTIYNRTHDVLFVRDANNNFFENAGYSIYYQFIAPGQFGVYFDESYKDYLGRIDLVGYQAAIDMFYSGIPSHDYLLFNNEPPEAGSYERLVANGNYYWRHQKTQNIIEDELVRELVLTLN